MVTTAIFVTVHKGASTFVADEFGPALQKTKQYDSILNVGNEVIAGKSFDDIALPPTGVACTRVYPQDVPRLVEAPAPASPLADKKLVLLWRDPRDVAVSLYYSKAYSHSTKVRNPEKLLAERAELLEMGVYEGVWEKTARPAIREFKLIQELRAQYPDALATSYEELLADPDAWLDNVAAHLEWDPSTTESIRRSIDGAFTPPSVEDPNKHKRRMKPGNWQEIFDVKLERLYGRLAADEMAACGYTF